MSICWATALPVPAACVTDRDRRPQPAHASHFADNRLRVRRERKHSVHLVRYLESRERRQQSPGFPEAGSIRSYRRAVQPVNLDRCGCPRGGRGAARGGNCRLPNCSVLPEIHRMILMPPERMNRILKSFELPRRPCANVRMCAGLQRDRNPRHLAEQRTPNPAAEEDPLARNPALGECSLRRLRRCWSRPR